MRVAFLLCGSIGVMFADPDAASPDEPSRRTAAATGRVTIAEFQKLHRKLVDMSTRRVWSIPWQLSVRKARELAAKNKKPVFLWISSNGGTHPLGPC